jgi:hypothetical protein
MKDRMKKSKKHRCFRGSEPKERRKTKIKRQ